MDVHEHLLAGNNRLAEHLREHFIEAGVLAIDAANVQRRSVAVADWQIGFRKSLAKFGLHVVVFLIATGARRPTSQ